MSQYKETAGMRKDEKVAALEQELYAQDLGLQMDHSSGDSSDDDEEEAEKEVVMVATAQPMIVDLSSDTDSDSV